jgi:uncharacterized membrane protein YfcA
MSVTDILVAIVVVATYCLESIFGFGGGLMAQAILGFHIPVKELIYFGMYAGLCSAIFVFATGYKDFSFKRWLEMAYAAYPGVIVGVIIFSVFSSLWLLKFFAIMLIVVALMSMLLKNFKLNGVASQVGVFMGGLIQGLYSTGGPFILLGFRDRFKNKSELRTTMAAFFITANLLRAFQLLLQGNFEADLYFKYWWAALPIALGVWLGYKIHIKVSEKLFKQGISVLILIAGVIYLFK